MSHRKTLTLIATLLTAATAFSVQAEPGKGPGKGHAMDRVAQADKDGDGKLSKEEAAAMPRLAKQFDQIDANKDGFISKDEMHAMRAKHDGERVARADTDRDGSISRAEADRFPKLKENFDKLDSNKDGVLSKEELKAAHGKHNKPQA